jgi:hypothetical protein
MAQYWVRLGVLVVQRVGGAAHHQARGVQFGGHVGEAPLQALELLQRLAELLAGLEVGLGGVERQARPAQRARGDVDPPAVEAGHGDLEALPFRPMRLAAGTRQSSKFTWAVGWAFQPIFLSWAPKERPASLSRRRRTRRPWRRPPPVRAMTT